MSATDLLRRVCAQLPPLVTLCAVVTTLSVFATGCGTESVSESKSANDDEVVPTESMSSAELIDFAAHKLSTAFSQKGTVEITVQADFMAMFSIFAPDQTEIDEVMAAEGVSREDTLVTFRTVNHFDGVNTMTVSTTDMPTFGEAPEESEETVTFDIDGVFYMNEAVNTGLNSKAVESWLRIDPGVENASVDDQSLLFSTLRQLAFENIEDVVDHGIVEHDGVPLRRMTAVYRGTELLGDIANQQSSAASDQGGAYAEQMAIIQQYMKDHLLTEFELFLDSSGDVKTIHFSSHVDAEAEYQECRWFAASAGTQVAVTFTDFPDGLVIAAPPEESVTTWDERLGAAEHFELPPEDLANLEKYLEASESLQNELQAEMDERLKPIMALCPGA